MRRCALPGPLTQEKIRLTDEHYHYLCVVLRLKAGAYFVGFDGRGVERVFILTHDEEWWWAEASGDLIQGRQSAPLTLCYGVPKGDKLERVARQLTELGVSALHLWSAERSVSRWRGDKIKSKHARLTRVISEAARQSGRADLLTVCSPAPLNELIDRHKSSPLRLFLDPLSPEGWPTLSSSHPAHFDPCSFDPHSSLSSLSHCVLCVGPEGGMTLDEINLLKEAGWIGVALASPILRTETAAIVACTIALDRLGYLA